MDFEAIADGCPWRMEVEGHDAFCSAISFPTIKAVRVVMDGLMTFRKCAEKSCAPLFWLRAMEGKDENNIYTVHAYRWGDRECHSYPVGAYSTEVAARNAARNEEEYRGGKYGCEICEWVLGAKSKNGSHRMPRRVIKQLPDIPTINETEEATDGE